MTRRISLVAAAGIAALALTASGAFAQAPPERRGLSDFGLDGLSGFTPAAVQTAGWMAAFNGSVREKLALEPDVGIYLRGRQADRSDPGNAPGLQGGRSDRVEAGELMAAPATPAPATTIRSSSGIEWPQVGFGLIAGILLALGLVLGLRRVWVRPLAQ